MPGELREKIRLWEVLNQILKNNGYLDIEAVTTELTNLKNQINVLLSDVLGLEHEIDDVHNYDDTDLKSKIDGLNTKLESFKDDVNSDVNGIIARITGINNTSSKISLQNLSNIEVSTMNADNHGTKIILTQQIIIQNVSESPIPEANPI
jgi:predicted  nucleic acid-binding Zn-ribbon protein